MSSGTVAVRYARALLRYAEEQGCQDEVYVQILQLARRIVQLPAIMDRISDPTLSFESKLRLLCITAESDDGTKACKALTDFLQLVLRSGRGNSIIFISSAYRDLYRKKNNVVPVEMTTASPLDDKRRAELKKLVGDIVKSERVEWNESVDPRLLGGFVIQVDDYRLDASVSRRLRVIEKELIEKNSRII